MQTQPQIYYCYSPIQAAFLKLKGIRYDRAGKNTGNGKWYYVFTVTDEVSQALADYKEYRNSMNN